MAASAINSSESSNQATFQNTAPITALPKDMIMEICRFLDICSVAAVMTSCKQLNQACNGQLLWKCLWLRDFSAENLQMQTNDWRNAYKIFFHRETVVLKAETESRTIAELIKSLAEL